MKFFVDIFCTEWTHTVNVFVFDFFFFGGHQNKLTLVNWKKN